MRRLLTGLIVATGMAACGGSISSVGDETDAGPLDSAAGKDAGRGDDGATRRDAGPIETTDSGIRLKDAMALRCNSIANVATPISELRRVPQDAPLATGGPTPDGTYVLTDLVEYTGLGGSSTPAPLRLQLTLLFSGNVVQSVATDATPKRDETTSTFVVSGVSFMATTTCATDGSAARATTGEFSIDPLTAALTFYFKDAGKSFGETFARR